MSDTRNNNKIIYKGVNIGKRNIVENIGYENAYIYLEYLKYLLDVKRKKYVYQEGYKINYYLIYIHEKLDDKPFNKITEQEIEDFLYFCNKDFNLSYRTIIMMLNELINFYNYMILIGNSSKNPCIKAKNVLILNQSYNKSDGRYLKNFITNEQICLAKEKLPEYLKLYMMFSLSTGATINEIRELRWEHIDFEKRIAILNDSILYMSCEVANMLEAEFKRRIMLNLTDNGYVFRSHIQKNYNSNNPISKSTISNWCTQIGKIIGKSDLGHKCFRYTAISMFLSKSGSAGMTSIIMNYPSFISQAKRFVNEYNNNELLQDFKDICEL